MKFLFTVCALLAWTAVPAQAMPWVDGAPPVKVVTPGAQILAQLEPEPISCLSQSDWTFSNADGAGWAYYGEPHIYVRDYICEDLTRVAQGTLPADNTTAEFAKLIAHEHAHVLGVTDESEAECAGVRGAPEILEKLGIAPARAEELTTQIVPFYSLPDGCS